MPKPTPRTYSIRRLDGRVDGPFTVNQIEAFCRDGACHGDEHVFECEAGAPESAKRLDEVPRVSELLRSRRDAARPSIDTVDLVRAHRPAVVQVRTAEGTGSGFAIDPAGLILTNLHVVSHSTRCVIHFENGIVTPGRVVFRSSRADLAVVQCPVPTPAFICLSRHRGDQPVVGDRAVALGFPLNVGFNVTEGLISAIAVKITDQPESTGRGSHRWLRTSAQINGGNSGGPILDSSGNLVGMATWGTLLDSGGRPVEGMNYAIPHDVICGELREFWERVRAGSLSLPAAEELLRDGLQQDPLEELDLAVSLVCQEFGFRVLKKVPIPGCAAGFAHAELVSPFGDTLRLIVDRPNFEVFEGGPLYLSMYCGLGTLPDECEQASVFRELLETNLRLPHWNYMFWNSELALRCSRELAHLDAAEFRNIVQDLTFILAHLTSSD